MFQIKDATVGEVDEALKRSWNAFRHYKKLKPHERAALMRTIAKELETQSVDLISTAARETNLDDHRLQLELKRTIYQLNSYGSACEDGSSLDIKIEIADNSKPDLRKMLIPLGPVVVFGASNFPFAYSTAGGDTACALAAGCPVIVKAHPAHPETSEKVANAIKKALTICSLSADIFIHLHGSFDTGQALVTHPLTRAVGFTGSLQGGRALFDLANKRTVPIPVFAEMGSVNPVFILPGKLDQDMQSVVSMYVRSITNSAGQFCTNPGIIAGIDCEQLTAFEELLANALDQSIPQKMLHHGISDSFIQKRKEALAQDGVKLITSDKTINTEGSCVATLATVSSDHFLKNDLLHQEVFGSFTLMVKCSNKEEMLEVARSMDGQLTATLMATEEEAANFPELVESLEAFCGRLILNGVPTGVEVSAAMHHGGPFPASTDSRFTAVGADGIKRFARPVCYQNWTNELLPQELRNENTLKLWRSVNGRHTNAPM